MNEIKPASYSKNKDKKIQYTKSLDETNKTIHHYDIEVITKYHIEISEPTIRKIYLIIGLIFGVTIHKFYLENKAFIFQYAENIKVFLFRLTPFARDIMTNTNFKFVFYISIVLTLLISILVYDIFYCRLKKIILSLFFTFIFLFAYLYLNFAVCHLMIKIPIYFKVLSTLAIIISNIIMGLICCTILESIVNHF